MRVTNNLKRIMKLGDFVTLLPGLNANVDEAQFRAACEIELVRWHVEQGDFVPETGDEDPTKMPEGQALKAISNTIQIDFLQAWWKNEKRPRVLAALESRLDLLKPPAPKAVEDAPKRK